LTVAQVKFESIDETTQEQARVLAQRLSSARGERVVLELEGRLAEILEKIADLMSHVDELAYGGLSSELSPEQAGRVLGVSRPLVVRRMDDGRLPFTYVGAHRRCKLADVLKLRAHEEAQTDALRELAEGMDELDFSPGPA